MEKRNNKSGAQSAALDIAFSFFLSL